LQITLSRSGTAAYSTASTLLSALQRKGNSSNGKRWVRSDAAPEDATVVESFAEIDQLLQAGGGEAG